MSLGFLGEVSNYRGRLLLVGRKVQSSYGWGEIDIFWPSQFRRSLNPGLVESFFPSLSTVGTTYSRDLCPEGILGLGYANVVAMLFSLFVRLLGLYFCFLRLGLCFLGLIFELLGFFQLFLKCCHLFLSSSYLVSGFAQTLPLFLGLPLYAFQGRVSVTANLLLTGQLFLQIGNIMFGYCQCLYSYRPFFPFIFQLLIAVIGKLFQPKSGLDSPKKIKEGLIL